jgi:hypothetical protein
MGAEMTFRRFPQPLAVGKRAERFVPNSEKPAVACDGSNRLLLNALLSGLSHAIRRDDIPAANRYRGRLQQAAEPVAADTQLKGPSLVIFVAYSAAPSSSARGLNAAAKSRHTPCRSE